MKKGINQILAKHSGQPLERVEHDADRDYYMSSPEALKYGLVDEVVETMRVEEPVAKS